MSAGLTVEALQDVAELLEAFEAVLGEQNADLPEAFGFEVSAQGTHVSVEFDPVTRRFTVPTVDESAE